MAVKFSNLTQIDKDVTSMKTGIGDITNINKIGDGTISGAIKELNDTSTKGIRITQEEYDKLSEDQKKGVYFIVDASDEASDFADKFHEYTSTITDIANKVGNTDLSNIIEDGTISSAISKLDSVITNADSLVYSNRSEELSDIGLQTDADLLGGELPSYYASKYDISDMNTKISQIENKVQNINRGKVFDTESAMTAWLKNANNKNQLVVGDSLYLREKDKPDYWVSAVYDIADTITGMYYEIDEMETQKVDLTDYDNKIGNVDISMIGNGSITGAISFLEDERAKLFQSVSDGKRAVANAITGKGVITADDAQFATMASNISKIKNAPTLQTKSVIVGPNGLTIKPDYGYDGLSTIKASVDGQEKSLTVKSGSYSISPDSGKVLTKVTIVAPTDYGMGDTDIIDADKIVNTLDWICGYIPRDGYYSTNSRICIKKSSIPTENTFLKFTNTNTGANSITFNVTSISGYVNYTSDNFKYIVTNVDMAASEYGTAREMSINLAPTITYNSTSGVVTVSNVFKHNEWNGEDTQWTDCSVQVSGYLLFSPIPFIS